MTAIAIDAGLERQLIEMEKCAGDSRYFVDTYCQIYDAVAGEWIPFHLWPAQSDVLALLDHHLLSIWLKARQIGMTWLALAKALHKMLFEAAATVLLFSKRDDEAIDLLDFRLKGMHDRLPRWMQAREVVSDNAHEWALSNGSRALAFPTTAGDSYTASLVIGDEFDLVPNQDALLRSVKPTIDNGGQMILLSRPDKSRPQTRFKAIYRAAKQGRNGWAPVFLPWHVHPGRDAAWYAAQKADILSSTGSIDDLNEQYPETDTDALAPRTLDKRIAPAWLKQCYREESPLITVGETPADQVPPEVPAVVGLRIFRLPERGRHYTMGADPAEGLAGGDDSSLHVLDAETGEEVAMLAGKLEPKTVFPRCIQQVGWYYNRAPVMVERNNHGHAVIGYLQNSTAVQVLPGHDGQPGWLSSPKGKVLLYDEGAAAFLHGETILHSLDTQVQIGSIEKSTLRAPQGEHDDKADSFMLALVGITHSIREETVYDESVRVSIGDY